MEAGCCLPPPVEIFANILEYKRSFGQVRVDSLCQSSGETWLTTSSPPSQPCYAIGYQLVVHQQTARAASQTREFAVAFEEVRDAMDRFATRW